MKLPILAYGNPVLKSKCKEIDSDYKDLNNLKTLHWSGFLAASIERL